MEAAISSFCKALSGVCNSVQSASSSLSDNVSRPPIPLESAVSMFLKSMDKHVSSANGDLNHLESMVFGTVSFEELLGHCNEVVKINQKYISDIEDRLSQFGYVPEIEIEASNRNMNVNTDSKLESPNQFERPDLACGSVSVARSRRRFLDDDVLFEESLSLKNLGLSDACLATLSSEGASFLASPKESSQKVPGLHAEQPHEIEIEPQHETSGLNNGNTKDSEIPPKAAEISVSKDVYDSLPVFIRNLATWEELVGVIEKLNSFFSNGRESAMFSQDDTEKLGLGRKGRSCLLMLLRLNQLAMESIDGSNFYRLNIANP